MTKFKSSDAKSSIDGEILPDLEAALGDPAILPGEDIDAYHALRHAIGSCFSRRDAIQVIYVREVTDMTWELNRLKRYKMKFLADQQQNVIYDFLVDCGMDENEARELSDNWRYGDNHATDDLVKRLKHGREEFDALEFECIADNLDKLANIDQLIGELATRRDQLVTSIGRYRETLQRLLRRNDQAIDAEFTEVSKPPPAGSTSTHRVALIR